MRPRDARERARAVGDRKARRRRRGAVPDALEGRPRRRGATSDVIALDLPMARSEPVDGARGAVRRARRRRSSRSLATICTTSPRWPTRRTVARARARPRRARGRRRRGGDASPRPATSPASTSCSRYFAPRHGIAEDPVTGAAHTGLGPYWAERLGTDRAARQPGARRGAERVAVDAPSPTKRALVGHASPVDAVEPLADARHERDAQATRRRRATR